jgi:hypothetical protein
MSQVKQVSIVVRGFDGSNNGYPSQGQMRWADGRHVRAVFHPYLWRDYTMFEVLLSSHSQTSVLSIGWG